MKIYPTDLPEVVLLEPQVFGDARGFFFESYNQRVFAQAVGAEVTFVQDNHSRSAQGVLRGLHYQIQQTQGKLVRVLRGAIWDVAVDLRRSSPNLVALLALSCLKKNHEWLGFLQDLRTGF
jgi:dTDP-4-dehydrorhamnose 3,5-epimerase